MTKTPPNDIKTEISWDSSNTSIALKQCIFNLTNPYIYHGIVLNFQNRKEIKRQA
jgi:hypothetical protein